MANNAGVVVLDTQDLYAAWEGKKGQTKLEKCCSVLEVSSLNRLQGGWNADFGDAARCQHGDCITLGKTFLSLLADKSNLPIETKERRPLHARSF